MTSETSSHRCGVLIGRFQPFHNGHEFLVHRVLEQADSLLIIMGSCFAARNLRNPWTFAEREQMIRAALPARLQDRVRICGIPDVYYSDGEWVALVHKVVDSHVPEATEVCLFGHTKDASSYYLKLFPYWSYAELPNHEGLSATPIREALLASAHSKVRDLLEDVLAPTLPEGVKHWLHAFCQTAAFAEILAEARAIDRFQAAWSGSPYPPVFVTVDALVQWRDEILLIRRGGWPGLGLYALPGGFLDPGERLEAACRRELAEETGLVLGDEIAAVGRFVGDHPDRSDRGRFVTHVFHYRLPDTQPRPEVAGGDDAASAGWHKRHEVAREKMFEDHYLLIDRLLGPVAPV